MSFSRPSRVPREDPPVPIHDRAIADLSFIRETMAKAGTFTSVPGWGGVAMGTTSLIAAWFAARQGSYAEWLAVWLGEAVVAFAVGGVALVRKAEANHTPLLTGAGRLFIRAFVPPLVAGMILTVVLYQNGLAASLPGVWLLLYGTAVTVAGSHSVRAVPIMGLSFMVLGAIALFGPPGLGDGFMALGFGGLQIGFGLLIARNHGG